jgi:hypothetical protein
LSELADLRPDGVEFSPSSNSSILTRSSSSSPSESEHTGLSNVSGRFKLLYEFRSYPL